MNAVSWFALGAALLLVPLGDPLAERLRALGARGRLHLPGSHARRAWPTTVPPLAAPVVGAAALAMVLARAGPVLAVAMGLAAATVVHLTTDAVRRRTADRSAARLLAAARLAVAEVTAGTTPDAALSAAAEVDASRRAIWTAAATAMRAGDDVAAAFGADPDLRCIGQAWSVAAATGAPVAAVLERAVADLIARREQARGVAAALAGPRSSALVLAILPVVGIALGLATDADPLGFLFGTATGHVVCLVGVAFDVVGLFWTRRLAARAATP